MKPQSDAPPAPPRQGPIADCAGGVLLRLRAQPRASREGFALTQDGALRVALMAPPVDGEANKALLALLAKTLGVAKSTLELRAGQHAREKTIYVPGLSARQARAALGL